MEHTDPGVEVVDCEYPLRHRSNHEPWHFLHGFIHYLNGKFGLDIQLTEYKGDVHLAECEKRWMSPVQEITGIQVPFSIINAGGKRDYTIKCWVHPRYLGRRRLLSRAHPFRTGRRGASLSVGNIGTLRRLSGTGSPPNVICHSQTPSPQGTTRGRCHSAALQRALRSERALRVFNVAMGPLLAALLISLLR